MSIEGAESSLDDAQVRELFNVDRAIDWALDKEASRKLLVDRFGWQRVGRRSLRLPEGVLASVLGTSEQTFGLTVWHTTWQVDHADLKDLTFRRAEHLREVVTSVVGAEPGIGELDTGEAYFWDRADGSRVWLDDEAIRFLSPDAAGNERFARRDPQRYASYGEDGEHA